MSRNSGYAKSIIGSVKKAAKFHSHLNFKIMIINHCEQHSPAWFDARRGRVTGTRFKSLMAAETTAAYQGLIAEVTAEIITGETEPSYSNDIMQRGTDLEPEARNEFRAMFDIRVDEVGFITPDEDSPFYEWIGISPDGLIYDSNPLYDPDSLGLLEIKCPLSKTHFNYIEKDKLPAEHRWQVQGQLFVLGLEYCEFFSYYPKLKPFIIRVDPNKKDHEDITERLHIFIEAVQNKIKAYNDYLL